MKKIRKQSCISAECRTQTEHQVEKHIQTVWESLAKANTEGTELNLLQVAGDFNFICEVWGPMTSSNDAKIVPQSRKQHYQSCNAAHRTDTNRKTHPNSEIIAKSNTEGTELHLLRC